MAMTGGREIKCNCKDRAGERTSPSKGISKWATSPIDARGGENGKYEYASLRFEVEIGNSTCATVTWKASLVSAVAAVPVGRAHLRLLN